MYAMLIGRLIKMQTLIKNTLFKHPALVLAPCEYGHGVFTTTAIAIDTTLEECRHLRVDKDSCTGILDDYVFNLEPEEGCQESLHYSLPLGWGSLYNHADSHNTEYWHDVERDLIIFYTIKDVSAGEQLFINYGQEWWDTRETQPSRP